MKYYVFQGRVDQMEERLFKHLLRNEPTAKELTLEEYEASMGIKQPGAAGKAAQDVGQPLGKDPAQEVKAPVRTEGDSGDQGNKTRQDYIKVLQARGFEYSVLKKKKLSELKEMY